MQGHYLEHYLDHDMTPKGREETKTMVEEAKTKEESLSSE